MKNILSTIAKYGAVGVTLVFLLAAPFAPLVAQAQDSAGFVGVTANGSTATTQDVINASNAAAAQTNQNSAAYQAQSVAAGTVGSTGSSPAATAPTGGSSLPPIGCSLYPGTWDLCITNVVYAFTVGIGSGFAYVSAYFFDWAIALSLNGTAYALDFVSQGWTTARDLANMAFLFILLYIAFKIIFGAETNGTVHMLTWVIVIALLVNFSFFFTRLAIDAGNLLAIQFYNAIQAPAVGAATGVTGAGATMVNSEVAAVGGTSSFSNSKDLTNAIMGMLNLQNLFNTDSFNRFYAANTGVTGFMVVLVSLSFLYIAAGVMFWLLTVAFITNGVKFLFRIVMLWFLIIASPLAFVAKAVPRFEGYFKQWLDALISNAFYPAAFMFIFLILTNFAREMGTNSQLIAGMFSGLPASNAASPVAALGYAIANVGIRMGFVIAMLYVGMEAAKRVGVFGAEVADHAGNWVGARLTGTYGRVSGFAGRNTLGWAGDRYAKSNLGRELAARGGPLGRVALRGAGALGRQSYDVRGAMTAVGAKETLVGKPSGEGGYTAAFDARVKMREEEAAKLKPSEARLAQAYEGVLRSLKPEQRQELINAAANYAKKKEDFKNGDADRGDVRKARETYNATVKKYKVDQSFREARDAAGSENAKLYATSIDTKGKRNLWGAAQGTPGWIRRAEKEAAAKIRGTGGNEERMRNVLESRFGLKAKPLPETSSSSSGSTAPGSTGAPGMAAMTRAAMAASQKATEKLTAGIGRSLARGVGKNAGPLGTTSADDRTLKSIRSELTQIRKIIQKRPGALSGHGSDTVRDLGKPHRAPGGVAQNLPAQHLPPIGNNEEGPEKH